MKAKTKIRGGELSNRVNVTNWLVIWLLTSWPSWICINFIKHHHSNTITVCKPTKIPNFSTSLRLNVFPVVFWCLFNCQECSRSWDPCKPATSHQLLQTSCSVWITSSSKQINTIMRYEILDYPSTLLIDYPIELYKSATCSLSIALHKREDDNYIERIWENVPLVLLNLSHRDRMLLIKQLVLLSVPVIIRVKQKLNKARTSILSSFLNHDSVRSLSTAWHWKLANQLLHPKWNDTRHMDEWPWSESKIVKTRTCHFKRHFNHLIFRYIASQKPWSLLAHHGFRHAL